MGDEQSYWRCRTCGRDLLDSEALFHCRAHFIAERDRLRAALLKYGTHLKTCIARTFAVYGASKAPPPCDCGLDDVLKL